MSKPLLLTSTAMPNVEMERDGALTDFEKLIQILVMALFYLKIPGFYSCEYIGMRLLPGYAPGAFQVYLPALRNAGPEVKI